MTANFSSIIECRRLLGGPAGALPGSLWRSWGLVKMASSSFGTLNRVYGASPWAQLELGDGGELLVGWMEPEDEPQGPFQGAAGAPGEDAELLHGHLVQRTEPRSGQQRGTSRPMGPSGSGS